MHGCKISHQCSLSSRNRVGVGGWGLGVRCERGGGLDQFGSISRQIEVCSPKTALRITKLDLVRHSLKT